MAYIFSVFFVGNTEGTFWNLNKIGSFMTAMFFQATLAKYDISVLAVIKISNTLIITEKNIIIGVKLTILNMWISFTICITLTI